MILGVSRYQRYLLLKCVLFVFQRIHLDFFSHSISIFHNHLCSFPFPFLYQTFQLPVLPSRPSRGDLMSCQVIPPHPFSNYPIYVPNSTREGFVPRFQVCTFFFKCSYSFLLLTEKKNSLTSISQAHQLALIFPPLSPPNIHFFMLLSFLTCSSLQLNQQGILRLLIQNISRRSYREQKKGRGCSNEVVLCGG